ncbi:MAG: aminoglycoside phosphotransferase family protein [Candidatus Sericytochromatia bacterium]
MTPRPEEILALLAGPDRALAGGSDYALSRLQGGYNNRVWRLELAGQRFLLKQYYQDGAWPRLAHEFGFLRFASEQGIARVPQALASLPAAGLALYEWIEGVPYALPGETEVALALDFLTGLQRCRDRAAELPRASEFCASLADHFSHLQQRLDRLPGLAPGPIAELVHDRLLPLWAAWRTRLEPACAGLDQPLAHDELCLSPSDFGFHNCLRTPAGPVFLDFEYAGWDDPAQLVCDFYCQFQVPAPPAGFAAFARAFANGFPRPDWHFRRMQQLLPVHRMKWICIALNPFLPETAKRRDFAGRGPDPQRAGIMAQVVDLVDTFAQEYARWPAGQTLTKENA